MKISTRIIVDIRTDTVIYSETFEYQGPVSLAISGSGSKSKQKSQSTQTSETGVRYNDPFLGLMFGRDGQPGMFGYAPEEKGKFVTPSYTPASYTGGAYTPGKFTAVAPEGFKRLEDVAYGSQAAKIGQGYKEAVDRQREELSQSGALNSQAQYLPGGTRAATDRSYLESLQEAARDAFGQRLGLEEREAGRRTGFDVGEAGARTAYDVGQGAAQTAFGVEEAGRRTGFDVGEAGRETTFNQKAADDLWQRFMAKLAYALEASKYSTGQGQSSGESSGLSGGGSLFNFFGSGSQSSSKP